MNNEPITLANCGHNFCEKCQDAYDDICYECDNGQPIEKVFKNKFLKEAFGKYKFITIVVKEVETNLIKIFPFQRDQLSEETLEIFHSV